MLSTLLCAWVRLVCWQEAATLAVQAVLQIDGSDAAGVADSAAELLPAAAASLSVTRIIAASLREI